MEYVVGERYPMTLADGYAILKQMGLMATMADGEPDVSRGRKFVGTFPDQWEFWMTSGQKVEVSISLTGNPTSDHFIASVGTGVDPQLPEPL